MVVKYEAVDMAVKP